jgi:hypothetical protein
MKSPFIEGKFDIDTYGVELLEHVCEFIDVLIVSIRWRLTFIHEVPSLSWGST